MLVTIVILAFGLLGVAGLQAMIYVLEFESYQRAQAVVILNDIADRVASNREAAATYAAASPLGGSGASEAMGRKRLRDVARCFMREVSSCPT